MSRTFVITGGAKGIGRCMVEYFASKGDKVYFIDNDAKTTIVVSNQLRGKDGMCMILLAILPTKNTYRLCR